jgi:predicted HTH transcriptional regulator
MQTLTINAIVHRDYASSSDSIVKIFDDRIEVFNPGRLPDGLSVEKLLTGDYVSNIRNRKIADMFKEAGLIEKYGTGIRRILREFEAYSFDISADVNLWFDRGISSRNRQQEIFRHMNGERKLLPSMALSRFYCWH